VKLPHILAIAVYCAFIFWLSSGPVEVPDTVQFDGVDKLAHMALYAVLGGLVYHGMQRSGRLWPPRIQFWLPVLFVALYGASDECHQYFVPTRSCDFFDWLADLAGGLAAAAALSLVFRLLTRPVAETLSDSGE